MQKGRILLVGEDKFVGYGLRQALEQEDDMEIIGDCISSDEAPSQAKTFSSNIVLMDALLPEMDAIEACRRLTENGYTCDVIRLTTSQEFIDYTVKAGTAGYFPKEIKREELVTAMGQQSMMMSALKPGGDFVVKPFDTTRVIDTAQKLIG